jgi:inosine/xanthosine triphosphatase
MKTVAVASQNPVKLEATRLAFERMFPGEKFQIEPLSLSVDGIPSQPMTDAKTRKGARLRAEAARRLRPQADYWVGIEGGAQEMGSELAVFAWVVVLSPQQQGSARSGTFFVPAGVATLVRQGKELGEADDIFFGQKNSKQHNGAIGLLTNDTMDRTELYTHTVLLALPPFVNPEYFTYRTSGE